MVYCGDVLEVASSCRGLGEREEDGVAERLWLFSTVGAEQGVVSIKPGGVSSQVAFLRAHLENGACRKLPLAHERVWGEVQRVGVVVWESERAPMLYDEGQRPPL